MECTLLEYKTVQQHQCFLNQALDSSFNFKTFHLKMCRLMKTFLCSLRFFTYLLHLKYFRMFANSFQMPIKASMNNLYSTNSFFHNNSLNCYLYNWIIFIKLEMNLSLYFSLFLYNLFCYGRLEFSQKMMWFSIIIEYWLFILYRFHCFPLFFQDHSSQFRFFLFKQSIVFLTIFPKLSVFRILNHSNGLIVIQSFCFHDHLKYKQ